MCMYVFISERYIQTYIHIYIFLNLNNACWFSKVFLHISLIPYNIQVKLELIILHFLLKGKTEAQGISIFNSNITKKLEFIVDLLKLYANGTM